MMSFIFYQKKENKHFELLSVLFHVCLSTAMVHISTFQIAIHFVVSFQIILYGEKCKARLVTFTLFIYSFLSFPINIGQKGINE